MLSVAALYWTSSFAFRTGLPACRLWTAEQLIRSWLMLNGMIFTSVAEEYVPLARISSPLPWHVTDEIQVNVRWSERHFVLSKYVAIKITQGATRNLLFQHITRQITEARIREDLEHIHNLVVVDIQVDDDSARVSLNSIQHSLCARSCLVSRRTYRGIKIDWIADECTEPWPTATPRPTKATKAVANKTMAQVMNRFGVLNIDGTEDGSHPQVPEETDDGEDDVHDEDEEEESGYGNGLSWTENSIATQVAQ